MSTNTIKTRSDDYLVTHLKEMAWHRAIIRSMEAKFFSRLSLERPILDVGCGDGHFASAIFAETLDAGIDVSEKILNEARQINMYKELKITSDNNIPYPDASFLSVFSNCVIEHIPDQEKTLSEIARVMKPNGTFVFSTTSHLFESFLWIPRVFEKIGLKGLAGKYRKWFTKISVHFHYRSPEEWIELLGKHGFEVTSWKYYMSREAVKAFEISHYYGVFFLLCKKLFGKWILFPSLVNTLNIDRCFRKYYEEDDIKEGADLFFVCKRKGS